MSEQIPNSFPQRNFLATAANPAQRLDYVITITRKLSLKPAPKGAHLKIRYIPDLLILDQKAIPDYLQAIEAIEWDSLESLAQSLLDDLCNELVARWIEISLTETFGDASHAHDYCVVMEDRQPNWSNPQLLSRLNPW